MMKKTILIFCLLLPVFVWSQRVSDVIDWNSYYDHYNMKVTSLSGKNLKKEKKTSQSSSLSLEGDQVSYSLRIKDSRNVVEGSLKLINLKYGTVNAKELDLVNKQTITNSHNATLHNLNGRGVLYTSITLNPYIKEGSTIKKLVSFTASYQYGGQRTGGTNVPPLTNSVLASGEWYKFRVSETGIQRISSSFLADLGISLSSINPQNIKVYGHGGQSLSLLNVQNESYQFDIPETSIQVVGGEDGSFDNGDYILFYGTNTLGYNIENDSNINPYADESYYYITINGGVGKRVTTMVEPTGATTLPIVSYDTEQFVEEDDFNPGILGRRWLGNRFDIESDQTFDFAFTNLESASSINIICNLAASSDSNTSMAITVNGTSLDPVNFSSTDSRQLLNFRKIRQEIPATSNVSINMVYNNAGNPSSRGYLDYIRVLASKMLDGGEGQFVFKKEGLGTQVGIAEYQLTNASQITQVWDITNITNITSKQNTEGAAQFSFKSNLGENRTYVAVHESDFKTPSQISNRRIANQNLKGAIFQDAAGNFSDIDYLIVVHPLLLQPALRLANHHQNLSGLRVKVVTTDKIYEEFSSGKQDISAIRNFVRYIYNNPSSPENRIKYLCLFGDTSVDYKDRLQDNNNMVPSFHTLQSFESVSSFVSDDFFGNLDINEGTIGSTNAFTGEDVLFNAAGEKLDDVDVLDVAVGRILADNVSQANALVSKIIAYSSEASFGNWRNNFMLISDDVDEPFEFQALQVNLDRLGDEIETEKPFINVKKIHSDAFQQISSAGGDRYPEANEEIIEAVEVGSLVINYFGHGGEDGLAKEFLWTKPIANELNNENRYPCIVTVTCEFTKFDNPNRITAGELTFWNPNGGAISLVTTTRSIFVSDGVTLNQQLAAQLFGYGTNDINTPAEALRISKNNISTNNRRVVFYIGDPALHLAFPNPSINLTRINGEPVTNSNIVLEALSKVTIEGEVTDENGALLTNYNGILEAKFFDKDVERSTLGNDGIVANNGDFAGETTFPFKILGEGIFNGQASVTAGRFSFEFVVPKDIQIPVGNGRVSFYAKRNGVLEDQTGFNLDIQVGGINEDAPIDNIGPEIQLFMNDESFIDGGVTNDSPVLIANMRDANGMNTNGGIGHDMVAILDGDEANPFVLNDFYQAEVDDFTKGQASFKFRDLEDGLHTISFKAWDVYNNSGTAEIQFLVAGDDVLRIERVLNYPNPFVDYTEFWFQHNRPNEPLDVQVQIFTVSGKVVKTINQQITNIGSQSRDLIWNGRDDFGQKIGKGVYVYKITVKSTLTNKRVEKFEKLVIL